MDFGLSDEQRLLQETIRGYAAAECPLARLRPLFEAGAQQHRRALRGCKAADRFLEQALLLRETEVHRAPCGRTA